MRQKLETVQAFEQYWQELHRLLLSPLTANQFIGEFTQASFLSKILMCQQLFGVIDLTDESIKLMKSSHALSFTDKKYLFNVMLKDFLVLCKKLLREIMPENAITYHLSWPLNSYLSRVDSLFAYIMNNSSYLSDEAIYFQKSVKFSVQTALLGSNTAFERHYPDSPEDMFMLIHQNSLIAVSAIYKSLLSGKPLSELLYLPEQFRTMFEHVEKWNINKSLIGITYDDTKIVLLYNMPLRSHSATFQLIYNIVTQEVSLSVQYLGQARDRWEQIAVLAATSPELSGLVLDGSIHLDLQGGIVTGGWKVKTLNDLQMTEKYLTIMNTLSFERDLWHIDLGALITMPGAQKEIFERAYAHFNTRIRGRLAQDWLNHIQWMN